MLRSPFFLLQDAFLTINKRDTPFKEVAMSCIIIIIANSIRACGKPAADSRQNAKSKAFRERVRNKKLLTAFQKER